MCYHIDSLVKRFFSSRLICQGQSYVVHQRDYEFQLLPQCTSFNFVLRMFL